MLAALLVALLAAAAAQEDAALPAYHFVPNPHNWMNDPNGPFYDPVHQMYHLMYQYLTPRVWGHAASPDLVHWTQLPIALDTDEWYDRGGVFSGSATILNDEDLTPVLSYSVSTNDMMCLAYPTNRSDPFLTQWTKYAGNPIISTKTGAMPGRDPTTAWRGGANQSVWRMGYGTDSGYNMYVSSDFAHWQHAGLMNSDDPTGMWECPDFFPIPNGRGLYVLKASTDGRDFWATGQYDDEAIRFARVSANIGAFDQLYDYGPFYASKSFFDPSRDRQVLWGWVLEERSVDAHGAPYGWASVQSLPREIVMHSDGVRIRTPPIPELRVLRQRQVSLPLVTVSDGQAFPLALNGSQIEVIADVSAMGKSGTICSIQVLQSANGQEFTRMGLQAGLNQSYMSGVDLPGGDYNVTDVNYRDPHICQAACLADARCQAWTFVVRPPLYASCCLKNVVPGSRSSSTCTSGVRSSYPFNIVGDTTHSSLNQHDGHDASVRSGPVPITSADAPVNLHLFVDHSVLELFANDGLAAITRRAYPTLPAGGAALTAQNGACVFRNVQAWELAAASD